MNISLIEHRKRLNPTGKEWTELTEEQQLELRESWNAVLSVPKNLNCTCPRTGCRNNRNCMFCVVTHKDTGSLPDCLRIVKDKLQHDIPPENRHNVHADTPPGRQNPGATREEYEKAIAEAVASGQHSREQQRKNIDRWHALVREPENKICRCDKTDCWYHGNCVKCVALHRYYDGFPHCCQDIFDGIDMAIQAYKAENAACDMA